MILQDAKNFNEMQKMFNKIKPDIMVFISAAVSHAHKSNKDPHYTL